MSRIPLTHKRTLKLWLIEAYSKRKFHKVLDPGLVAFHNPKVLATMLKTEGGAAKWNTLDATLKALAVMTTSAEIGCSWCMDYGYWEFHNAGVDPAKLRAVPNRDAVVFTASVFTASVFTETERLVMDFAVAMTNTPPTVTDEQVVALRERLSDAALVELTAVIALENQRSRINAAMGLTSQGFTELCEVRAPHERTPDDAAALT